MLVRTSNPGAADVEDLELADGRHLWERLATLVAGLCGDRRSGLADVGAVVGATVPEHLARMRELMPRAPFLLPGIGAQGGRVEDLAPAFAAGRAGGLVSASRSIARAHEHPAPRPRTPPAPRPSACVRSRGRLGDPRARPRVVSSRPVSQRAPWIVRRRTTPDPARATLQAAARSARGDARRARRGAAGRARPQRAPSGEPRVQAKAAIVVEGSTGDVLYEKNADQRRSIASTTKLMTVLVALQKTDLDDVFSASNYHASAAESQLGLRPGERMSVRDLLRATLLPSANDAAATIAVGTMGSTKSFVAEMNRRAQVLGLSNTHYTTPIGLDNAGNYSSARDLARLAIRLRGYEFFAARPTCRARRCAAVRATARSSTATRSCAACRSSTASRPATPRAPATCSSARPAATA